MSDQQAAIKTDRAELESEYEDQFVELDTFPVAASGTNSTCKQCDEMFTFDNN